MFWIDSKCFSLKCIKLPCEITLFYWNYQEIETSNCSPLQNKIAFNTQREPLIFVFFSAYVRLTQCIEVMKNNITLNRIVYMYVNHSNMNDLITRLLRLMNQWAHVLSDIVCIHVFRLIFNLPHLRRNKKCSGVCFFFRSTDHNLAFKTAHCGIYFTVHIKNYDYAWVMLRMELLYCMDWYQN